MQTLVRDRLRQLTAKSQLLSQSGKFMECIDILQQIVGIKKEIYGLTHPQCVSSTERLCECLNVTAMGCLQRQELEQSLQLLRKAQLVARGSAQYRSTTYNNLACYYRKTGKMRTALMYLVQALDLELKVEQPRTLADTHLNLCAVLSQLDRHEDALQHALLSIVLVQDQLLAPFLTAAHQHKQPPTASDQRLAVLAIAYHNLGVEFQHLKRFDQAVKIYNKALLISKDHVSQNQDLINKLTTVVQAATQQIHNKNNIDIKRIKLQRDGSERKKDIYKDFARQADHLKNMPRLQAVQRDKKVNVSHDPYRVYDPDVGNARPCLQSIREKHPAEQRRTRLRHTQETSLLQKLRRNGQC